MKDLTLRTALTPGFIAIATLSTVLRSPRVAALHGAELIGLLGAGFGFGAALALFSTWYQGRKDRRLAE